MRVLHDVFLRSYRVFYPKSFPQSYIGSRFSFNLTRSRACRWPFYDCFHSYPHAYVCVCRKFLQKTRENEDGWCVKKKKTNFTLARVKYRVRVKAFAGLDFNSSRLGNDASALLSRTLSLFAEFFFAEKEGRKENCTKWSDGGVVRSRVIHLRLISHAEI